MKRMMLASVAGGACLALLVVGQAKATILPAPQPVSIRVAVADAVVVGKVTGFAARTVPAARFAGDKAEYQIALVKVSETVLGKGDKEVKVGFFPPPPPPAVVPNPKGPVLIRPIGFRAPTLTVGQEACLFLTAVPGKDFYALQGFYGILDVKSPNFAKDVAEARKAVKLLANPREGLKSKDAEERLTVAGMLINRYRTSKAIAGGVPATEPINAEESKLILEALANADWAAPVGGVRNWAMNPQGLFSRLGVTAKDGWVQPKDFRQVAAEAQKWLKANAGKYRIQRYVAPKAAAAAAG
jgi:hypothetical protein